MKIKMLFFLSVFLLHSILGLGQCNSCTDTNNRITDNGDGTLTAASAQEYYWEICQGSATISGSNTNQTVSVNASGDYRIKLRRFNGGNCTDACEIVLGCSLDDCPTTVQLLPYFQCEDGYGAYANIDANCVSYVAWIWNSFGGGPGAPEGSTVTSDPNILLPWKSTPPTPGATFDLEVTAIVHLSPILDCPAVTKVYSIQCPN